MLKENHPIGIFDSGIGGLTVARALVDALPNESIIYFGDTAHLPYGDKSVQAIQGYAKKITDFLLTQEVKLILIACNSASAAAYEMLGDYIGSRALLVNVIDPVSKFLSENYAGQRVGLIGTKLTVESGVYNEKLSKFKSQIDLRALATPLLVHIIEEGYSEHKLIDVALTEYLSNSSIQDIEALVLGCTHYQVIKDKITDFYQNRVDVIDAAKIVASKVGAILMAEGILATAPSQRRFYVSDYTDNFAHMTKIFFGQEVEVQALDIF
ncbi:MAG: glutamate racemase [Gammaproteobacteria bacterium]|nr:glutamate racemase [Gammaproteobacteria bacterium]